jgi:hypothetical protein
MCTFVNLIMHAVIELHAVFALARLVKDLLKRFEL